MAKLQLFKCTFVINALYFVSILQVKNCHQVVTLP